jgi:hypothetical protein
MTQQNLTQSEIEFTSSNDFYNASPDYWSQHEPNGPSVKTPKAKIIFQNDNLTIYENPNYNRNAWLLTDPQNWS